MSTSNLTSRDYSFQNHGEVYTLLEQVFTNFGITYFLIGANARDIHLYNSGIKPIRITADIDFAVMVPDFGIYSHLQEELCNRGFRKSKEPYRLTFDKTDTILDLMPYGKIEEKHTVNFDERNLTLSVLGFREVGEHLENVAIKEEGFSLPVSPIEGLFILKLISWKEKPSIRTKDLEDISFLLQHAWEIYEEEAYIDHPDLFDDDDFDMQTAAAKIIGKKMAPILAENSFLYKTIINILETAIMDDKPNSLEVAIALHLNITVEKAKTILTYLLNGIKEKRVDA